MTRVFNFSAGPATLPPVVLEQAQAELLDWGGQGSSIMEISHRSKEFMLVARQAESDLRQLLDVPTNYKVLFLQGGATLQFSMVPLNILGSKQGVDFVNTGHWSTKAIAHTGRYAKINVAASNEDSGFRSIPPQNQWSLDTRAAYVHYTPNETIGGVEFHWMPEVGEVPLVADMSSTLLSRPIDVSKFGVIYAGAQKNIGPSGITVIMVRDDLLDRASGSLPDLFNYQKQAEADSMLNTSPTFSWYMAGLVFKWLLSKGGLETIAGINRRKSQKLYTTIDESGGFYYNLIDIGCRSWMNVPFNLADSNLDSVFLSESKEAGLAALKGHSAVGGMRASIYNAMPEEGVDALIDFMKYFQQKNG